MQHGVGKISTRDTTLVWTLSRSDSAVGSYELPKFRDSNRYSFGTISGLPLGSPEKMCHSDVVPMEWRKEFYMGEGGGGKVMASPESGPWWVLWVKVPVACPNTQGCPGMWTNPRVVGCPGMWTNPCVVGFGCKIKLDLLVPLPNLIPGLLARPSTLYSAESREHPSKSQLSATLHSWTFKWVQLGTWECVIGSQTGRPFFCPYLGLQMSKWLMQGHFGHLHFKTFPLI